VSSTVHAAAAATALRLIMTTAITVAAGMMIVGAGMVMRGWAATRGVSTGVLAGAARRWLGGWRVVTMLVMRMMRMMMVIASILMDHHMVVGMV
jgi:hypothetical protein